MALCIAMARASLQPTANIRTTVVDGADKLTFCYIDGQGGAVTTFHAHVRSVLDEMRQSFCVVAQAFIIATSDAQIVRCPGKAAGAALDAFGHRVPIKMSCHGDLGL